MDASVFNCCFFAFHLPAGKLPYIDSGSEETTRRNEIGGCPLVEFEWLEIVEVLDVVEVIIL